MKEKKEKFFKSIKRRDPAARYALQILLTYPGVKAIIWYRVAHFFFSKLHLKLIGEMIAFITRKRTGIEIHPGCKIGRNLFIDHGMGVVIGETATIGDNCTMYHGVTLGAIANKEVDGRRHPTIGSNVMLGAKATILGPVTIGDNAKIGASPFISKAKYASSIFTSQVPVTWNQAQSNSSFPKGLFLANFLNSIFFTFEKVIGSLEQSTS